MWRMSQHAASTIISTARHLRDDHPKPFVWTAKASDIVEKVKLARKALND
jgi:hypothetical protein